MVAVTAQLDTIARSLQPPRDIWGRRIDENEDAERQLTPKPDLSGRLTVKEIYAVLEEREHLAQANDRPLLVQIIGREFGQPSNYHLGCVTHREVLAQATSLQGSIPADFEAGPADIISTQARLLTKGKGLPPGQACRSIQGPQVRRYHLDAGSPTCRNISGPQVHRVGRS